MSEKPEIKEGPRYKIILVGDVNVGKTALFWRYIEGEFLANKSTLVTTVDFKMKNIVIDNKNVKLYLWDTAGSEQYRSIVTTYFKGCHGVAVVFDLSRYDLHYSGSLPSKMQLSIGFPWPAPKHPTQHIF